MVEDKIIKTITVNYNSLEELFDREEYIIRKLITNLEKEDNYKFIKNYITNNNNRWILNLEIMKK